MSSAAARTDEPPEPERDVQVAALLPMLDALGPLACAELERALRLTIRPAAIDPVDTRVQELGALAELLVAEGEQAGDPDDWPGVPIVARRRFEQLHGQSQADAMVRRYGSWLAACRAAASLRVDGRCAGPGRPWVIRPAVRDGHFRWTADACLSFVRQCALELGRRPTSKEYNRWRRQLTETPGRQNTRAPWPKTICAHVDPSWPAVLERCGVTDAELAAVRAARLPQLMPAPMPVADRLAQLDAAQRQLLSLTATQLRKLRGAKARHALPLTAAVDLARALGGSLAWLAGHDEAAGEPPGPNVALDVARVTSLREQMKVGEKNLREAGGLSLGEWRRLMTGSREPTLGELAGIAGYLGTSIEELLADGPPPGAES